MKISHDTVRVLLVEDNPGDARLISEMMRELGDEFDLYITGTLQEGLDAVQQHEFDVVLLDLSLPDSFGVATISKMRAATPALPIVVMTGFNDQQGGIQAVQEGAQDYLIKGEVSGYILSRSLRYSIERHRAEEALRRSEHAYRSLINDVFNTSSMGVLISNRDYMVVWVNAATEEYFGISREELIGQDKRDLINKRLKCVFEDPDGYAEKVLKAYMHRDFINRFECRVTPGVNRKERWLEHWIQPIHDGMYAGGWIGYYSDITERKMIETAEREQSNALAALEERQRIARELHDSVSQTLFTSSVMAESALRQWDLNPEKARTLVEQLHQLTHSALAEMRVLLMELRPASITRVQFKQLVEQLMRSYSTRRLLETEIVVEDVPPLPPDTQLALYRILQEAVNNVIKHANASRIAIRSWISNDMLHMSIEDDGCGFNLSDVGGSSLGLNIMRERAEGIGALLDVKSGQNKGTSISVTWPMG